MKKIILILLLGIFVTSIYPKADRNFDKIADGKWHTLNFYKDKKKSKKDNVDIAFIGNYDAVTQSFVVKTFWYSSYLNCWSVLGVDGSSNHYKYETDFLRTGGFMYYQIWFNANSFRFDPTRNFAASLALDPNIISLD